MRGSYSVRQHTNLVKLCVDLQEASLLHATAAVSTPGFRLHNRSGCHARMARGNHGGVMGKRWNVDRLYRFRTSRRMFAHGRSSGHYSALYRTSANGGHRTVT
jgi:hypothetical protein